MKKGRFLALLLSLSLVVSLLAACGSQEEETAVDSPDVVAEDASWAVYWYLCGSDLESDDGSASADLEELQAVSLPENVRFVIETGGSSAWRNEQISADTLGRYLYDSEGFSQVDELPSANMGEAETLRDFLSFCTENYPADRQIVIFWNHGGGSVSGVAFDDLYGKDSLTLDELQSAFSEVFSENAEDPALEMVGFDACLMSTIDTASALAPYARYLVASEESEPGCGWDYTSWVSALVEDTTQRGDTLGTTICDSYQAFCNEIGQGDEITLAVTDLQKLPPLLAAVNDLGKDALYQASQEPSFFSSFGREASRSENYGGNTPDQGYTNMVDLGHLVRNSQELLPDTAQQVSDALEACIVYKVNGPYRSEASGLSCFYSYDGDTEEYGNYARVAASAPLAFFSGYGMGADMDSISMNLASDFSAEDLPENLAAAPTLEDADVSLGDYPLSLTDDGYAEMNLGREVADLLTGVYCRLYYVDEGGKDAVYLGRDNDLNADWESGVFTDNFRGVWGSLDGSLCYMELTYEGEDYNLYSIPITLNDEADYNLRVVYRYSDETWEILGAKKGLADSGMADKNLVMLKEGDRIVPTLYAMSLESESDELSPYSGDEVTFRADSSFSEISLPDGIYIMLFELVDSSGNEFLSEAVRFDLAGGEITTSI